jgi:hypothetical protein
MSLLARSPVRDSFYCWLILKVLWCHVCYPMASLWSTVSEVTQCARVRCCIAHVIWVHLLNFIRCQLTNTDCDCGMERQLVLEL